MIFFVFLNVKGIKNVLIVGVFSPASGKQELQVADIIKAAYPEMSITLSHQVGLIGLLERENASILNESLKPLCQQIVNAFCDSLEALGLNSITQNDGTIILGTNKFKFKMFTLVPYFLCNNCVWNHMSWIAFMQFNKYMSILINITG